MNNQWRIIGLAVLLISMLFLPACSKLSNVSGSSAIVKPEIVRQAQLGENWSMQQMTIEVPAEKEVQILLKLGDGDRVDGYFILEKGDGIEFQVKADSLIYEARSTEIKNPTLVDSDRFAFIASKAQGTTYTLVFRNPDKSSNASSVSVYAEVVYPITGTLFTEIAMKK